MPRLASEAKGMYYPTPDEVVDLLIDHVRMPTSPYRNRIILDPSCGTGSAVVKLAQAWGLRAYGNEIEAERHKEAKEVLEVCVLGPYETLAVTGKFGAMLHNPPYADGMEVRHLALTLDHLAGGGIQFFIPPFRVLQEYEFWRVWCQGFENTEVFRFPDGLYDRFKQHVVVGTRRRFEARKAGAEALAWFERYRDLKPQETPAPVLGSRLIDLSDAASWGSTHDLKISNHLPRAAEYVAAAEQLPSFIEGEQYRLLTQVDPDSKALMPLTEVEASHVIQIAACGMVSGQELAVDGRSQLMSAESFKYWAEEEYTEVDEKGEETDVTLRVQKVAYRIRLLDMQSGRLRVIDSRSDEYAGFIEEHLETIMAAVRRAYPPLYQGDYSHLLPYFEKIHSPGVLPGVAEDGLLVPQKHDVAALLEALKRWPAVMYAGEQGVGKTISSLSLMAIHSGMLDGKPAKIVMLTPALPAPKTAREAEKILSEVPGLRVKVIGQEEVEYRRYYWNGYDEGARWLWGGEWREDDNPIVRGMWLYGWKKTEDGLRRVPLEKMQQRSERFVRPRPLNEVDVLMQYDGPALLIVPYQTAKNGARWHHVTKAKRQRCQWRSREPEYNASGEREGWKWVDHDEEITAHFCTACGEMLMTEERGSPRPVMDKDLPESGPKRTRFWCKCGAPAWEVEPFQYGGRFPVAEYIGKRYARRYVLITDEVHRGAGADTDLGYALMDLVAGAKATIGLTGTPYNAYPKFLFYLQHRLNPAFRDRFDLSEANAYALSHGLISELRKIKRKAGKYGAGGYRREPKPMIKFEPGATPEMIKELLPWTIFRELWQMGVDLPARHEKRVPVRPIKEMREGGLSTLAAMESAVKAQFADGNRAPFAQWWTACLGWPDCPEDDKVSGRRLKGLDADVITPKEAVVLNLVDEAFHDHDTGVCVFFDQVNRRSPIPRLKARLEDRGYYVSVLTSAVDPLDRIEWVDAEVVTARERYGQPPLLLTGNRLLTEGVDMLDFRYVIVYSPDFDVVKLSQYLARFHRLGVRGEVFNWFLYYEQTLQEHAMELVAEKVLAANQITGRVGGVLSEFNTRNRVIYDLMKKARAIDGEQVRIAMAQRLVDDKPRARLWQPPKEKAVVARPAELAIEDADIRRLVEKAQRAGDRTAQRVVAKEAQQTLW